ncbi:MAG TPA: DUF1428 domain-containing protein [Pyrinomonadaceae bacterium]|nr:DUF1428 domain-containing protein [Pyrinomonadaceae bacterium]
MSKYIDGFLLPIAAENIEKYREIAQMASEIFKEHGALEYVEAVGDDLEIEKMVSFNKSAGAGEGETVVLAYIVYESKEHRDQVNAAVMQDERKCYVKTFSITSVWLTAVLRLWLVHNFLTAKDTK